MRKKLLLFLTMGLLLAGCSVSEMNDSGMLNVSIGDDGRYIAGGSSRVDNAYLGLIDQDVLYNFDEMETVQAEIDGTILHTFSGVPVGDYTFIAMLMDADDHNIAMALDPVTIEEGLNELVVEMGPGFTLEIGGLDFDLDDLDDAFSVDFSDDVIIIELGVADILDAFTFGFSNLSIDVMDTNAQNIKIYSDWTGTNEFGTFTYSVPASEEDWSNNNTLTLTTPSLSTKLMIRMYSWGTTGNYADEKGYKDYKIQLDLKI